jgi:hypothetical protein
MKKILFCAALLAITLGSVRAQTEPGFNVQTFGSYAWITVPANSRGVFRAFFPRGREQNVQINAGHLDTNGQWESSSGLHADISNYDHPNANTYEQDFPLGQATGTIVYKITGSHKNSPNGRQPWHQDNVSTLPKTARPTGYGPSAASADIILVVGTQNPGSPNPPDVIVSLEHIQ